MRPRAGAAGAAANRWRADVAAARFHLRRDVSQPPAIAILGGTGTGKSTVLNRLLGADVSAASFRRTFTAGAVAVTGDAANIPAGWLGIDHVILDSTALPARGSPDALAVVVLENELIRRLALVDTPDLDGDQPAHHAQADRVFRWAEGLVFLVSPEKYQMTELLPYYRLARRYGVPSLFVMNKCETPEMLEDYRRLLESGFGSGDVATEDQPSAGVKLFAIPRDDAGFEPPAAANLSTLRWTIAGFGRSEGAARERGLRMRASDLLGRLQDQVLSPLREDRKAIERVVSAVKAIETPPPGVDVNPLTEQLQRRLQQRSVLYLMGPGRVLDRVRQVPGLLVRLPRTAWDFVFRGKPLDFSVAAESADGRDVPDFRAQLVDQFRIVQSRVDDVLRSTPAAARWVESAAASYDSSKIDPENAGRIADEELAELKDWLQKRWNATPRDTALLMKVLKHLPGGERLTQWSEAAPYLLALVVATHHAIFGPVDLVVLGGWSVATWLTERLSNEVAARTRLTNRRIADRFAELGHDQIRRTIDWIQKQAPSEAELDRIARATDDLAGILREK